ncbi:hypothetical protein FA15DRAFT_579541, partial [Coprinopsis marcescibilis]
ELCLYLSGKGKYKCAADVVEFTKQAHVQGTWDIRPIHLSTAKRWLKVLGFRFVKKHRGLYVDGHERDDVVEQRQTIYIPRILVYDIRTRTWTGSDMDIEIPLNIPPGTWHVVIWYHDESTFYAHDRREARWVSNEESPTPYAKGEGVSLMVAD